MRGERRLGRVDGAHGGFAGREPLRCTEQRAALDDAHRGTLHLGPCLVAIASVSEEAGLQAASAGKHNQSGAGARKAAKISHVRQVGYEQCGYLGCAQALGKPFPAGTFRHLFILAVR